MNINATLFGQMITFAIFIWVTMTFVWPPIRKAMEARENEIAEGLKAAEKGQASLQEAQAKIEADVQAMKSRLHTLQQDAEAQAQRLVAEARDKAQQEHARIVAQAEDEIAKMVNLARADFTHEVSGLVVKATEAVLKEEVTVERHQALLNTVLEDLPHGK